MSYTIYSSVCYDVWGEAEQLRQTLDPARVSRSREGAELKVPNPHSQTQTSHTV